MKGEDVTTDSLYFDRFGQRHEKADDAVVPSASGGTGIHAHYLPAAEAEAFLRGQAKHVLGVVCHGITAPFVPQAIPVASVAMTQLVAPPLLEIWASDLPVSRGARGALVWGHSGDFLFGLYRQPPHEDGLESGTFHAYQEIFALLNEQETPHLLRVWNYFSAINADDADGLERYKHFCIGRYESFAQNQRLEVSDIPAASAVGSQGGEFVLYFLAATRRGKAVENDRQVSAYEYPPQYGPRTPLFARATQLDWLPGQPLLISGTASIVGHASIFLDDTSRQTSETLNNIRRLIALAFPDHADPLSLLHSLKVYVRNHSDLPTIRALIESTLGKEIPSIYLLADICRSELLLEIEAIAGE